MVPKKEPICLLLIWLCLSCQFFHGYSSSLGQTSGTIDGSEQWGYVEVRPKAHLFWWLYKSPHRVEDTSKTWPTILWLQGGPGGSGVGFGNFMEIGPLDSTLKPRNLTWLNKADLLFVDSPVGTGFSYVEEPSLVVKTDYEAAADLTTLLMELFNNNGALQRSPLFIFAESYGGKFAVTLALTALQQIEAGKLKLQLGGVALGDSWISPEDFVFSWGPLLKDVSRIDDRGLKAANRLALQIQQQIKEGKFEAATNTWNLLENVIFQSSNEVSFYNFMLDSGGDVGDDLSSLMNGPIRKKLGVIPENITWGGQGDLVFPAMAGDFMKPRIDEVDMLLSKPINVTLYNGQLDLICATKGVEAWLSKLKWDGLSDFLSESRTPLYCGENDFATKAFLASHKNLFFYWILGAGHMVPSDQPCISLQMVGKITQSPTNYSA